MLSLNHSRRDFLRTSVGLAGLTLPTYFKANASTTAPQRKAKSCIIVYTWGGMSHYESFDPKPEAPAEIRGEFKHIKTATPGIHFCEHLPMLAKHSDKLAIVRSVHHKHGGHGSAMYVNMTGHNPVGAKPKSNKNWPSLASMMSYFHNPAAGTPRAIRMPYSMFDNGGQQSGEHGGWLGSQYDPILVRTPAGEPWRGVNRYTDRELNLKLNLDKNRIADRRTLLTQLDNARGEETAYKQLDHYSRMAADMLLGSPVRDAYDLEKEDPKIRDLYGNHMGGQSLLLARRLVEAGVPVVQTLLSASDLAGGSGDNWDTHRNHFPKMKDRLLPVFDRSVSALLTDLEMRGMLEETLVVFLTDFGRTPKVNGNGGRDHYPNVYSLAYAGGGIQGGQVYGASNKKGTEPAAGACSPADIHATAFRAMGIDPRTELHDQLDRPFQLCDGNPLPLF